MRKMRMGVLSLVAGVMVFAVGCAPMKPRVVYNTSNPIKTVAVLPVLNHTNDVEAPENIRKKFEGELAYWGYKSKPLAEVNKTLKDELGITLGKQLDLTNPVELGQKLGVDAVIYGTLFDFDEKTTGVLDVRRVKAGFKMVIAKDLTSQNLSPFANLKEEIEKSWFTVLKAASEAIDAEEKAGKMSKEQAGKAREDIKMSYNITTLDITKLAPPQVKWGTAGTTFWARGTAVKGTTKATGGLVGMVATGANILSRMADVGDLKNTKAMSEYPGIEMWIELPQQTREVENSLSGVGMSFAKSLGGKTLGKMTGSFLKEEGDRVITEIVRTMPVGPGGI
ncbi:MAG: GNA1162 family protein [Deltaproteobacteria bacterium]